MSECGAPLGLNCPLFATMMTTLKDEPVEQLKDDVIRSRARGILHILDFMAPLGEPVPVPLTLLCALEKLATMFNPDDTFVRGMAAFFGSRNASGTHVSLTASGRRRLGESVYAVFCQIDILAKQIAENPTTWHLLTAWPQYEIAEFVSDSTTAVVPANRNTIVILGDPVTIFASAEHHDAILQTILRKWPREPVPSIDEVRKHLKFSVL